MAKLTKLTKRSVEAAEIRASDYFLWCDELPGFGIRIFASGRRSYLVQYRSAGRTRRVTIGLHGPVTAEQARKEALSLLGQVAKGEDPAEDKAARRKSLTVAQLCANYLAEAEKGLVLGRGGKAKKASSLIGDRGRVEHHIVPLLGNRLVQDLTRVDVQRLIRDVQAGRTAKSSQIEGRRLVSVTGGAGAAARAAGLLGGILSHAINEGIISSNPAHGVKRPADKKRDRRLSPEEFGALGRVLSAAEAAGDNWQSTTCIRLLCLTGCRLSEISSLRWAEVDIAGKCLRLADTKEGRSVRPLGAAALKQLSAIEKQSSGAFVIPTLRGQGGFTGTPDAIRRYTRRAGLDAVSAHTLRHSFASMAGDLGYGDSTIGAMLGHAGSTVTSRYVHHLDAVLVAAADKVSEHIAASMAGEASGSIEAAA